MLDWNMGVMRGLEFATMILREHASQSTNPHARECLESAISEITKTKNKLEKEIKNEDEKIEVGAWADCRTKESEGRTGDGADQNSIDRGRNS